MKHQWLDKPASCASWHNAPRRTQHHFSGVRSRNASSDYKHKDTTDKPKLRDVLQNNWSVPFKYVKVMKDKERLRSESKLKETKEAVQLHATCDPRSDPGMGLRKAAIIWHYQDNCHEWIWIVDDIDVKFPDLDHCTGIVQKREYPCS